MKVVQRGKVASIAYGTYGVNLEDWSESYPSLHVPCDVVAAYPIAQDSNWEYGNSGMRRTYPYPKRGESFRVELCFDSGEEAKHAFKALLSGKKDIKDFWRNIQPTPYLTLAQILKCL